MKGIKSEPMLSLSYNYYKFGGKIPSYSKLLQVFKSLSDEISWSFRDYDTLYFEDRNKCNSQFPKGLVMVLLFRDNHNKFLWTHTLPFTIEKWKYYKKCEGQIFKIRIKR